jgi:hypothetical protein
MTIPQLRKAFEHVETFVELHCKVPKADLIKQFKQEWKLTFKKEIETKEAEAYVEHALDHLKHKKPSQRKHSGGAQVLAGAPLYAETRPGEYISAGVNQGSYAQVPAYVDKGFWNPEMGRQYDPVPGQTVYPAATPYGMGSNRVIGGTRKKRNQKNQKTQKTQKNQAGGSILGAFNQFLMRPTFASQPPPTILDDATTAWMAKPLPQGPDPTQSKIPYQSSLIGVGAPALTSTITTLPTISDVANAWWTGSSQIVQPNAT